MPSHIALLLPLMPPQSFVLPLVLVLVPLLLLLLARLLIARLLLLSVPSALPVLFALPVPLPLLKTRTSRGTAFRIPTMCASTGVMDCQRILVRGHWCSVH